MARRMHERQKSYHAGGGGGAWPGAAGRGRGQGGAPGLGQRFHVEGEKVAWEREADGAIPGGSVERESIEKVCWISLAWFASVVSSRF